MKKKRPIPNPHDAFFRRIFGRPEVAAEFFRLYLPPEVVAELDLSKVKLEDASFVDVKLREHFSDLLFRVGLKRGGEAYVYLSRYSDEELKGAEGLAAALKLLKHIFRSDLPEKLPEVFIETARDLPEERALDQVKTMVSYLTESQRVTESQIENALLTARSEGGRMETVFDRMEKKLIQRGRQEGAAELILSMLRRQIGALEQKVEDRISALPVAKLKRLGEELPGFKSLDDLEKWLRRYAPVPTRRVKVTKSQGRKKASQK